MTENKKIQIEFAPGCFDNFDGTQEELDEFIAELTRMAESGELQAQSQPLDDDTFNQLSQEEQEILSAALDRVANSQRRLQ